LVSELDVDDEKADSKHYAQHGTTGEDDVDCQVDLRVFDDSQRAIFRWRTTGLKSFMVFDEIKIKYLGGVKGGR
jgi:hypothetical protein